MHNHVLRMKLVQTTILLGSEQMFHYNYEKHVIIIDIINNT